jgi:hypothetical protein
MGKPVEFTSPAAAGGSRERCLLGLGGVARHPGQVTDGGAELQAAVKKGEHYITVATEPLSQPDAAGRPRCLRTIGDGGQRVRGHLAVVENFID